VAADCSYGQLWEGQWPVRALGAHHLTPPTSYVVAGRVAPTLIRLQPDDHYSITLRLIGRGHEHLRDVVLGVANANVRSKQQPFAHNGLRLHSAVVVDPFEGSAVPVFQPQTGFKLPPGELPQIELPLLPPDDAPDTVRLNLLTPLALKHRDAPDRRGEIMDNFDPVKFTQLLAQRLEELVWIHEDTEWPYEMRQPYVELAQDTRIRYRELTWVEYDRESYRTAEPESPLQPNRIPMMGLMGQVVVENVHPMLLALWKYAELIHAGSNISFGMGAVSISDAWEGFDFPPGN
jgi:hypothetical protein